MKMNYINKMSNLNGQRGVFGNYFIEAMSKKLEEMQKEIKTKYKVKIDNLYHSLESLEFAINNYILWLNSPNISNNDIINEQKDCNEELRKNNEYDDSNLLWFLFGSNDGVGHMKRTYVDVLSSEVGVNAYRHFFEVLLQDSKRVVYFHCSQGKDRAGIASYLFLSALGVSEEDKIADYLYSNEAMQVRIKQYKAMLNSKPYYNKEYEKALEDVFSAKLEYLFTAIKFMEESCGGVLNYLVDVLHVDIDKLRNYYLE